MIESKAALIEVLHEDLQASVKAYNDNGGFHGNIGNCDSGKTALKRKITYLRRELLNLEKEIENDAPWRNRA